MANKIKLRIPVTEVCQRCYYSWIPNSENPTVCPRCHSPYWNKPRILTK